jgi:hypothetical protein
MGANAPAGRGGRGLRAGRLSRGEAGLCFCVRQAANPALLFVTRPFVRYNLSKMDPSSPTGRPRSVTLTLWGVFLLGIWNVGRALALFQQRELLQELAARPDPMVRLLVALMWGCAFFVLAEGLRRKRPFSRPLIPLAIALYALYEISLLAFIAPVRPPWPVLAFDSLLALLGVSFAWWALRKTTNDEL